GDIQLVAGNGISLQANTDVTIRGDNGYDDIRKNTLQGQSLQIQNKKADVVIDNTTLTTSVGDLSINSEGKTTLSNSELNSKGNTELSTKDHLTLQNIEANADKHMALSSKKNIYFNSKYGSTATPVVWDSSSSVNLKAKGILSMVGMDHIANRTTYTGGAISLEANNLISPSAGTLTFNAMDSSVLTNDPALKNLEGDLTI
ncbi:hemagglutinin, partial [Acinetobacter baumannii]|nr:hemagglutinin [Acinetobacter baumannii]